MGHMAAARWVSLVAAHHDIINAESPTTVGDAVGCYPHGVKEHSELLVLSVTSLTWRVMFSMCK